MININGMNIFSYCVKWAYFTYLSAIRAIGNIIYNIAYDKPMLPYYLHHDKR